MNVYKKLWRKEEIKQMNGNMRCQIKGGEGVIMSDNQRIETDTFSH